MSRMILVSVLISVSILAIAGGIGYWIYNGYNYYTTDDAQVTGQTLNINSSQSGQLTALNAKLGQTINAGQIIGTISTAAPTSTPTPTTATNVIAPTNVNQITDVTSPIAGTVIQLSAVQGQNVTLGLPLAEIADLTTPTVTAYIDETTINNVKTGQQVDVHVDAYSSTTYTGSIQQIVQSTASQFSLLPTTDYADGNFTKVGQRIPVVVSLAGTSGNALVPGMSAEVTIHLH
ncbi:MAG TPA: HlyD family efflux transporter periplasmic adaptor subunit [Ktedonobacteraceae bacterium]